MTPTPEPGSDYWPGGWNPDHPSENRRWACIDNGDGTATETRWDEDGVVLSEQTVPYQSPPALPTLDEGVAELRATVAELLTIIEGT